MRYLLILFTILQFACQSTNYFDINADFESRFAAQETRAIFHNAKTRGRITSVEKSILKRSGNMYLNQLIQKLNDAEENEILSFSHYKNTIYPDAKSLNLQLSSFIDEYTSRDNEIDQAYESMLSRARAKLSAEFVNLLSSKDYSEAAKIAQKSLEIEGDKELSELFTAKITRNAKEIKLISEICDVFEIESIFSVQLAEQVRQRLIKNALNQISSLDLSARRKSIGLLEDLKLMMASPNFPQTYLDAFSDFERKVVNTHTTKIFVVPTFNKSDFSTKNFTKTLENELAKVMSVNQPFYINLKKSNEFEQLSLFDDDYYDSMSSALEGINSKEKGMALLSEIRSIKITNAPLTNRIERAKPFSSKSAFRDGMRSSINYSGNIQHYEWTEETKRVNASIFLTFVLYDLNKNKILLRDSIEAQKSYKQIKTFDLMAVGQDINGYGNPVGPIKRISASWRPQDVDSAFKGSRSSSIPDSSMIRLDLFKDASELILKSIKSELVD